jgi:hypothetical protein
MLLAHAAEGYDVVFRGKVRQFVCPFIEKTLDLLRRVPGVKHLTGIDIVYGGILHPFVKTGKKIPADTYEDKKEQQQIFVAHRHSRVARSLIENTLKTIWIQHILS